MSGPTLRFTYDGLQLAPAPKINVTKEPIYTGGGDNIMGLNYKVELNGYALNELNVAPGMPGALLTLDMAHDILHRNGKTLLIWDLCRNMPYMTATGGKLISWSTEEGQWYNYVKYNATFEFSDLSFNSRIGSSVGYNFDSVSVQDPNIATAMMGLKSFNDNWNFVVPESEAYMYYTRLAYIDQESNDPVYSAEDYSQIQVSYNISATGKNYYLLGDVAMSAWELAKNFVQYKLYHQIAMFRNGGLLTETPFANTFYSSREFGNNVNQAITSNVNFQAIPVIPPVLDRSIIDRYSIYNETIDCSTSESDGSFSATYNCTIKRFDPYLGIPQNSVHTFTSSYQQDRDFRSQNRTITINGSLQGMLRTNIIADINDGQNLILPQNGTFYNVGMDTVSKFGNAYEDFVNCIVNPEIDDLADNFKKVLAINYQSLFPASIDPVNFPCIQQRGYNFLYQILAEPKSFSANYNYRSGTVEYTATYDTERACAAERGFESMTITEDDALPLYAEHTIVGRTRGSLFQNLNTNKVKTITISFQGVTKRKCGSTNPFSIRPDDLADPDFDGLALNPCDTETYTELPDTPMLIYEATEQAAILAGSPLIERSFDTTYNPADGSYSISKSYYSVINEPPNDNLCVDP